MKKKFSVLVSKKIKKFKKIITVESDKSISHRSLLIASQCVGPSSIENILESEDVKNTANYISNLLNMPFSIFCNKTTENFYKLLASIHQVPPVNQFLGGLVAFSTRKYSY